jgi:hypothetical protein
MHRDEVLFANEAFYLAFSVGDLAAMDSLWADRPDVVCMHPGWPALTDRDTVMESWARILGNPDQPEVGVHAVETVDLGDVMLVVCYEQMGDTVLVANNVFMAGPDGPRMVAHQSGLCSEPPELPQLTVPSFDA